MKLFLIFCLLIFKLNAQSQKVVFSPDWTYKSFFVLKDITEQVRYKKTVHWIIENRNAELKIRHKIKNELLIIDGMVPDFFFRTSDDGEYISYTIKFTLEISMSWSQYDFKYTHNYFLLKNGSNASIDFGEFVADNNGSFKESAEKYKRFTKELEQSLFKVFLTR
jgi:hypothetical protein